MKEPSWTAGWRWAALAWLLGLCAQLHQPQLWSAAAYLAVLLLACALALCGRGPRIAAAGLLGWAVAGLHACAMPDPLDPALEGRDLDVIGRVEAMVQPRETGVRLRLLIEQAQLGDQTVLVPRRVDLGWYGSADAPAQAGLPLAIHPGERWRFRVRLKAAHGHLNPRGFDYELWLWERGIRATGHVRQGRGDPAPQRLGQTARHPLEWARQQVRDRLLARWPAPSRGADVGGVLAALVTGDQAAIDRVDWDLFRATGVSHLMSISGVHVTMLGWLVGRLAARLWRRSALWGAAAVLRWPAPSVGALAGLAAAAAYALFSGWGVPAQRTVWMLATATLLRLSVRDWHWRHIWLLAGALVLLLDPWALLQPGFWLSFVAVGVLMATAAPPWVAAPTGNCLRTSPAPLRTMAVPLGMLNAWMVPLAAQIVRLMREQALITVALLPLSLLFFGQFSPIGLLANLVAIPWVTLLVTPLALLGVLMPVCWDLSAWALQPLLWLLGELSAWRWASLSLAMPPWPLALAALGGAALLVVSGPLSWRLWGLPLLLPALLWQPPRPPHGHFELLAADVGQGSAVLLRTARHTLLYDAGPRYSPDSDAGHRVLVPLLAQSAERLDVLMLSHRDSDHTGGAQAVLAMQPQTLLWSSLEADHPLAHRAGHRVCEAGQRWQWDGVSLEVLYPQPGTSRGAPNASSCVLRVQGLTGAALLTGDIEFAQEQELLKRGLAPVDWLLVPHHGSRTSSSAAWIDALQPRLAVVQAGYRNRFGHPAPEVVERYRARGTQVQLSAQCGASTWRSDQPDRLRCEREAVRRYWHHRPPP